MLALLYKNDKPIYLEFCYRYLTNYYKFRSIIKKYNFKLNENILQLEKEIIKQQNFKKKIQYYILKCLPKVYLFIRNYKNSKLSLYD